MNIVKKLLLLMGFVAMGQMLAYTHTFTNQSLQDMYVKLHIVWGNDKDVIVKAGETERIGVGGYCVNKITVFTGTGKDSQVTQDVRGNDCWGHSYTLDVGQAGTPIIVQH